MLQGENTSYIDKPASILCGRETQSLASLPEFFPVACT